MTAAAGERSMRWRGGAAGAPAARSAEAAELLRRAARDERAAPLPRRRHRAVSRRAPGRGGRGAAAPSGWIASSSTRRWTRSSPSRRASGWPSLQDDPRPLGPDAGAWTRRGPRRATLGGLVATNAFGPRRTRYGGIRDLIIGISIVRADGTEARGGGQGGEERRRVRRPEADGGLAGDAGAHRHRDLPAPPAARDRGTVLFPTWTPTRVRRVVLALRQAQLEPAAVAALVREGGDDLGVRFDGRFELGVRFEGFEAGVRQQAIEAARARHAPGLGRGARSTRGSADRVLGATRPTRARPRPGSGPSSPRSRSDLERVANAAIGSLFTALERPALPSATRCWGWPSSPARSGVAGPVVAAVDRCTRGRCPRGAWCCTRPRPRCGPRVDVWGPRRRRLRLMAQVKDRLDPGRRLAPGRFVGGL